MTDRRSIPASLTHVCPLCGCKMDGPFLCFRTDRLAHPRTASVPIERPTTAASAKALEKATSPVPDPHQPDLNAEDGFDV